MLDDLPGLFIFLIPLAIFIGRMVMQARKKGEGVPQIPLHFEEDKDEEVPARMKTPALANNTGKEIFPPPRSRTEPGFSVKAVSGEPAAQAVAGQQGGLPLTLGRLSPLKQAVVMAEVLGVPKGLTFE